MDNVVLCSGCHKSSVWHAVIAPISVPDVKTDIYNEVFNLLEIEQLVEV